MWPWQLDESRKMRGKPVSGKTLFVLCLGSFLAGSLFTSQTWTHSSQTKESQIPNIPNHVSSLEAVTQDRDHERVSLVYSN